MIEKQKMTLGDAIATAVALPITAGLLSGVFYFANSQAQALQTDFYANKPDQTNWPSCTGRQVEWLNGCLPPAVK